MVLRLLENTFVSQKMELVHVYPCPQAALPPGFCHDPPDKMKLCFSKSHSIVMKLFKILIKPAL